MKVLSDYLPLAPKVFGVNRCTELPDAETWETSPSKNRVRGFSASPSGRLLKNPLQPVETVPGCEAHGYETASGRPVWQERDPIGERGGIDLYEYVHNDPVTLRDPSGLLPPGVPINYDPSWQPGSGGGAKGGGGLNKALFTAGIVAAGEAGVRLLDACPDITKCKSTCLACCTASAAGAATGISLATAAAVTEASEAAGALAELGPVDAAAYAATLAFIAGVDISQTQSVTNATSECVQKCQSKP